MGSYFVRMAKPEREPKPVVVTNKPDFYTPLQYKILLATNKIFNADENKPKRKTGIVLGPQIYYYTFNVSEIADIVFDCQKSTKEQINTVTEEMEKLCQMRKKVIYKSSFSRWEYECCNPIDFSKEIRCMLGTSEEMVLFRVDIDEWMLL